MKLLILNTESDLPSEVEADFAFLKDYDKQWKLVNGEWVDTFVTRGQVPLFDYRFSTGEKPKFNGGRVITERDGTMKILKTHNADHQEEWEVEFIGF